MTTHRLNHLACGARDPGALSAFYSYVLDLPEVDRHVDEAGALRSVWHDLGDGVLLMIERIPDDAPEDQALMRPGLFLLAITIDPRDRGPWEARLEEAGCTIESRTPFTSYTRDPENNRIAVSHYPHTG